MRASRRVTPPTCTTPARRTRSGRTRCAALAPADRRDEIDAGRPWAKSGCTGGCASTATCAFRHELASLLLLDGPLRGLLADVAGPDLARYLVLAHHGKLRVQVRDPGDRPGPGEASSCSAWKQDATGASRRCSASQPPS